MTKRELDFIGSMNMCDEISNKAYQKIVNHFEETQPSDDCVSRAEVIDELNRLGRNAFKDDTDYDNFFAFVDALPPVTPTQEWNLISEYEPPKDRQLMFCNKQGSVFISQVTYRNEYCSYVGKHGYFSSTVGENTGNIIAWAELPKPYEEKRGDSDGSN